MWFVCITIFFCTASINGLHLSTFGTEFEYLTNEITESLGLFDESEIKTSWIEQPLDHFDSADGRTWKMRYFENHDYWKPDKPIYLFLSGEATASAAFIQTGTMFDLAKETGGAMYVAEHRYYGESKPFDDFTAENLKYLSSKQALADFAALLKTIKSMSIYKSSKVVVVGGSYSGNLAAWMKLMYPDLVDAAIASSGPVLAKKDFNEYLEVVSEDFVEYGSEGCSEQIELLFSDYERYLSSEKGIEILKKEENICDSCNMNKLENQQLFISAKASGFMVKTQYGTPEMIQEYCKSNFSSNFRQLKSRNLIWDERNSCHSYDFDDMITSIRKYHDYVAWIYQTCTEFGYYQTGSSSNQVFSKKVTVDFYAKMCTKLFGPNFDEGRVDIGVSKTNDLYGGLSPNVSHVVFVNGNMDPWSSLSVLEDLSYNAPAKVIPRSSHCRDLFSDRESDPEELKEARKYIRHLIRSWIEEDKTV